jgi:hypothetical protein
MPKRDIFAIIVISILIVIGTPWAFGFFAGSKPSRPEQVSTSEREVWPPPPSLLEPAPESSGGVKVHLLDAETGQPIAGTVTWNVFKGYGWSVFSEPQPMGGVWLDSPKVVPAFQSVAFGGAADGYVAHTLNPITLTAGQRVELNIVLEPLFSVTLERTPDQDHGWVRLLRLPPYPDFSSAPPAPETNLWGDDNRTTVTLTRGKWCAQVGRRGSLPAVFEFKIGGDRAPLIKVQPVFATGTSSLRAQVLNWEGKPDNEARIYVTRSGPGEPYGLLFVDSSTRAFENLPAGHYVLNAQTTYVSEHGSTTMLSSFSAQSEVDLGENERQDLSIQMPLSSPFSVRVLLRGKPVRGAEVYMNCANFKNRQAWASGKTDENGELHVESVAAERVWVVVSRLRIMLGADNWPDACEFTKYHEFQGPDGSGKPWSVDIELAPAGSAIIHGEVPPTSKEPFQLCVRDLNNSRQELEFDLLGDGRFTLLGVPRGRYLFTLVDKEREFRPFKIVDVQDSSEIDLKFEAARGHRVAGTFRLPSGDSRDVTGRAVLKAITGEPRYMPEAHTDLRGDRFEFSDVVDGRYLLSARSKDRSGYDYTWSLQEIEVRGGDVLGLILPINQAEPPLNSYGVKVSVFLGTERPEQSVFSIHAYVTDASGRSWPRESVNWSSGSNAVPALVLHVPAARCTITLEGDEIQTERIALDATGKTEAMDIHITLKHAGFPLIIEVEGQGLSPLQIALAETLRDNPYFDDNLRSQPVLHKGRVALLIPSTTRKKLTLQIRVPEFEPVILDVPASDAGPRVMKVKLQKR